MTKQLSSLDMYFVLKELKDLEGSKVDRIYNNGKEELYVQLYKSNAGKKILRIIVGKAIFLTGEKSVDEKPSGFCMGVRKHFEGKFLDSVEQLGPERIFKFVFKAKDETKKLYLEFFGKGNVISCNNEDIIIDCSIHHKFKDRAIVPREKYKYPNMEYNVFKLQKSSLTSLLKNTKKDKIVTSLAVELGLGGTYSEEACLLSNIDKNTQPEKINSEQIKTLTDSIKKLIKSKKNPKIVYEKGEALDVAPINLEFYEGYDKKEFSDFNEALDFYFTKENKTLKKEDSAYARKIKELKRIIEEQKDTMENMKNKEIDNRKKGEIVYNNYQLIKDILDEINKASKKYSWEEIKNKLKGHKVVKDVDVKEKQVVIDISKN